MPDERIPVSVAQSEFKLGGVTLRCHVLDDGRRIIEQEGMEALLAAMADGSLDLSDTGPLADWMGEGRRG